MCKLNGMVSIRLSAPAFLFIKKIKQQVQETLKASEIQIK